MSIRQDAAHSLRVLLVEDYADTAVSLTALLRRDGYEVHVAADGPAALQAAEQVDPDAVLLDIAMPGMDGWAVARDLRARANGQRPLIVAITGHGREEDHRRSEEAGIDLHLLKPVDPVKLQALLAEFRTLVI